MIIKVTGEHNFFLFQDICYYFLKTIKHEWGFPIKNIYESKNYTKRNVLDFVYCSWLEVLREKLMKCEQTTYCKELLSYTSGWMVTTNLAITTAQKGRGREGIPSWELEWLEKYKPYFLIEHSDDFEIYTIHLDGEYLKLFKEAIYFYESFKNMKSDEIKALLERYWVIECDIKEELDRVCSGFAYSDSNIHNYKIVEE